MSLKRYPTIGIIGTINHDFVITKGFEYEDLGGILYNILGFHYLSNGLLTIKPVANFGYDIKDQLFNYLKDKDNITLEGLREIETINPIAHLKDVGAEGKYEILENRLPRLTHEQISILNDCDLILVNFISGRDVDIEALWKLRESCRGIIYTDIHSLTLGIAQDGSRYYRQPECWKEILETAEMVQMNLKETITVLNEQVNYIWDLSFDKILELGFKVVSYGSRVFILTLGKDGAILFYNHKGEKGYYQSKEKDSENLVGEATGCGDILTSAFTTSLLSGSNLYDSLDYAVKVTSDKYTSPGLRSISSFNNHACSIPENTQFSIDKMVVK